MDTNWTSVNIVIRPSTAGRSERRGVALASLVVAAVSTVGVAPTHATEVDQTKSVIQQYTSAVARPSRPLFQNERRIATICERAVQMLPFPLTGRQSQHIRAARDALMGNQYFRNPVGGGLLAVPAVQAVLSIYDKVARNGPDRFPLAVVSKLDGRRGRFAELWQWPWLEQETMAEWEGDRDRTLGGSGVYHAEDPAILVDSLMTTLGKLDEASKRTFETGHFFNPGTVPKYDPQQWRVAGRADTIAIPVRYAAKQGLANPPIMEGSLLLAKAHPLTANHSLPKSSFLAVHTTDTGSFERRHYFRVTAACSMNGEIEATDTDGLPVVIDSTDPSITAVYSPRVIDSK